VPPFTTSIHRASLYVGALAGLLLGLLAGGLGCALGPDREPGCEEDSECDPGWSCREGACFHVTTGTSPPRDPEDAGGGG
jgi:hypothetical protein